ncbi:MAG: choice-of-anchor N protein [Candidatus Omnitrophota bacterium]|nr:choice-of-anchor N protein [Candidatus Omnitrophota bacterium]
MVKRFTAVLFLISLVLVWNKAYAVPNLQIYIPGASYIDETWEIASSDFELWVIAANRNLKDVYLTMAVPDDTGSIALTSQTTGDSFTYSSFSYGTPYSTYGQLNNTLPTHGIYPSYYAQHSLGDIPLGSETVYDMVGGGSATGTILKFDVSVSGFSNSHYDAYGYYLNPNKPHYTFSPFSHDGAHTPEPASLSLLGLGLLGVFIRNKRYLR